MELRLQRGEIREHLQVARAGAELEVACEDGSKVAARILSTDRTTLLLEIDGRRHRARYVRQGAELHLHLGGLTWHYHRLDEEEEEELVQGESSPVVQAPMPGKVMEILVEPGQTVVRGEAVLRVEAMKMEVELHAGVDGEVETIHVAVGDLVEPESPLVTLRPEEDGADS